MRRKTFFTCKQSSSQDELAFMEEVRSAADEGDIAGMSVEDAICLVYVIGVKAVSYTHLTLPTILLV